MRRLAILRVVLLTIGIVIVGMASGVTPHARAQTVDCGATAPPVTPTSGSTGQSQAIKFNSPDATTFTVGKRDTFEVDATTPGPPYPSITMAGPLPSGVTYYPVDFDGMATLSGTPDAGTGGTYTLIFTAHNNGVGADATQVFTLTVDEAPAITSANGTAFTVGTAGTFTVNAKGCPTPSISITTGTLPSGVTFRKNGDGTATLSGTPDGSTGGTYPLTISAANGVLPDATQSFTLTLNMVPPTSQSPTVTPASQSPTVTLTSQSPTVTPASQSPTVSLTSQSPTVTPASQSPTVSLTSQSPTVTPASQSPTVTPTSQSSSRAGFWWLAALAAVGVLIAVITGAVVRHRRAKLRRRIRAAPHPDAGTVNLDRSEPALAHTVRLEPHADRGTTYLEDEP
jgi:Putative Ig domain